VLCVFLVVGLLERFRPSSLEPAASCSPRDGSAGRRELPALVAHEAEPPFKGAENGWNYEQFLKRFFK